MRCVWPALALLVGCGAEGPGEDPGIGDGFLLGVNYPWRGYGHDFGSNAWGYDGVSTQLDAIGGDLSALEDVGVRVVRWFVFGNGAAGLQTDPAGLPVGLEDRFFDDFDAALDLARAADVYLVPVLLDYLFFADAEVVDGVRLGGHAPVATDPAAGAAFLDGVLRPLLATYGGDPRVFAWDLMNEPGWLLDGNGAGWLDGSVPTADLVGLAEDMVEAVHDEAEQPVTLGAANIGHLHTYWGDLDVDIHQFHLYAPDLLPAQASELGLDGPVVVGELSSADPGMLPTLDAALAGGYRGAWPWSFRADDDASDLDLEDLRAWTLRNPDAGS